MEPENQNTTVETEKINKKPFVLLAVILIILISVTATAYFFYFKKLTPPGKKEVQTAPALLTIKTKSFETASEKGIQLYLASKNEGVEVSAFQIKLDLPEGIIQADLDIKSNAALEDQGWVFPIARAEEEEGETVIKFSGFRLGNSPYTVKGNLLLATISSTKGVAIATEVDKNNTLLYSSDAVTTIAFDSASE